MKKPDIEDAFVYFIMAMVICMFVAGFYMVYRISSMDLSKRWRHSNVINGHIETRCISGHVFVISPDGNVSQVMDSLEQGVKCNE